MSKINTLRIVNLNYNNNSIKISDEAFQFNGESTLMSLRNGGGKTVLVQMMTAPFVHKRYRDTKDRKFESYFTTNRPTFIMVEWVLDGEAGYVLTGMMVRKNQEVSDGEAHDELEMINFVYEYTARCENDIYHIPIINETESGMTLKNWGSCKKVFEKLKREDGMHFNYYDMDMPAQSRMYFEKLKQYQINYKEWETIIKKINIVNNPSMIIADEPTGNLDPDTAWEIMNLLKDINARGTTVVVATHAKDIVDRMKQRVIQIEKGNIIRDDKKGGYDSEV